MEIDDAMTRPYQVRTDASGTANSYRNFSRGPSVLAMFLDTKLRKNEAILLKCWGVVTAVRGGDGLISVYRKKELSLFRKLCRDSKRTLSIDETVRGNKHVVYYVTVRAVS